MTDLRIRSEPVPDARWAQPFLPPQARVAGDETEDFDSDFGPLLAAAGRRLGGLFGLPANVRPGRRTTEAPPRCDPALVTLLATIRLGGDPARPVPDSGGANLKRHHAAIAAALDAAAAEAWPPECLMPDFDVEIVLTLGDASITGAARITAPPRPPRPVPLPLPMLRVEVLALPMQVRVELASELIAVNGLFPLHKGRVLPIVPAPDMPLLIGQHSIGMARVTPLPDGRQQAEIIAIGIKPSGGRL